MRVVRSFALALPPLLRKDQAASITKNLPVRTLAPLRGVGPPALPTGHGAVRLAVAASRPVRVGAVVVVVVPWVGMVHRPRARVQALVGPLAVGAVWPGLALPRGPQAVVPDGRDAADAAGNVARQLGHEQDVPVAHDWDRALSHEGLMIAYYGTGEI